MVRKSGIVFFSLGLFCAFNTDIVFAQANGMLRSAVAQFESSYPDYRGKVSLTGGTGERTWEQQMEFCLTRPTQYPNICRRFTTIFGVELPSPSSKMTEEMRAWWQREIMAQAGRPDGFAHIGGKAQDVWVADLDNQGKQLFESIIRNNGLGIIYEKPPK
jgi:hypothetical protein